jgi:hypothetical protein
METRIQLTHPAGKKAPTMPKAKYDLLRKTILQSLKSKAGTSHAELLDAVNADFKKNKIKFEGAVGWHMEWVKLDMESKKEIKRLPGESPIKLVKA